MFIFLRGCTKLHEVAANHNAGIGVWAWSTSCGVIVYCYSQVLQPINKGNLLFAAIQLSRFHTLWNVNNV